MIDSSANLSCNKRKFYYLNTKPRRGFDERQGSEEFYGSVTLSTQGMGPPSRTEWRETAVGTVLLVPPLGTLVGNHGIGRNGSLKRIPNGLSI